MLIVCSCPDVLGPTAFAPVKSDINGNIKVMYAVLLSTLCVCISSFLRG